MKNEIENVIETAIVEIPELKSDRPIQPHNGKKIDEIIVSQYLEDDPYAVTYSREDNSILGWLINIRKDGQQQRDVDFKPDQHIVLSGLYKKILVFHYDDNSSYNFLKLIDLSGGKDRLIDLSGGEGRPLQLTRPYAMGFLPNGDLIIVLRDQIYLYSIINKPKRATLWEYSQLYDIKSLNKRNIEHFIIYQTKLFLFNKGLMTQWDLLTRTIEMQYNLVGEYSSSIVINKNQTLLALNNNDKTDIFSMETGIRISRYENYIPVEFVTLKDGSEGLLVFNDDDRKYKFLDPFHPSDAIDTNTIDVTDGKNIIITKSNKKLHIKENNVWVTDGLNENTENTFQQMLNITYHSNIYNLSTFKTIQNMLKDIINNNCESLDNELADSELFRFNLKKGDNGKDVVIKGLKKSQNNNEWKETQNTITLYSLLSYKQLNNQDLALITEDHIYIYTIVENSLRLRYLYYYTKENILNDDLQSLPSPSFDFEKFEELTLSIINYPVEFSKFGSEILIAIQHNNIVQLVFDKIIELIEIEDYGYVTLLPNISLNLPKLYDLHHTSLVMKYILHTSILLDPSCSSVKNSTNSLCAYSKNVYIFPSNNNYFKRFTLLYKKFKSQQTPAISFIVPFPQICKYQDKDYNSWNEILHKPKSILFCNIDSNNFYKWWNFAAIVDFKWKTFGKFYYFLIWFFYTIFFICFALASILKLADFDRKILFIITILLGLIHLSFEIRQFLWKPKAYIKDPFNLFDVGAYFLPIIISIYWLINRSMSLQITAISILLLNFKFLLFFQVFQSYGKYFAIIIGVAEEVFPFLVVLFFIILGFGFAFFILLGSTDPWELTTKYNPINSDGTINFTSTLIQTPDSNANMFNKFSTSLLAMYLLLTGDSGSLSSWSYIEDSTMTFLLFLFTFFTVIYLMNLFIGLLNMAIENYNKHEEFLLLKARIIMGIELFYMSYSQRRTDEWFPDWIYYTMPVDEVRKLINAIDDHRTEFSFSPFISKKLRELIKIPEPINEKKSINELQQQIEDKNKQAMDKLEQISNELKQTNELIKDMQKLLNSIIENSNSNDNNIKMNSI